MEVTESMKKQKCTYVARREEAQELRQEMQRLTSELQKLEFSALSPEDITLLDPAVKRVVGENHLMMSVAKNQQLTLASAQSMLAASLGPQEAHPLYTRICLTNDWDKRRKTLMAVRQQKLRNAFDFFMAPGRFADPDKPHTSDHRYETGDICSVHIEVVHFPGVESLEKVWQAVLFHYNSIDIDISERLGHTTARDDYDSIDGSVQNIRVLSRSETCTAVESRIVTFSHLFSETAEGFGGRTFGILAVDCIDEDELYRYFPQQRAQLDKCHELQAGIGRWGDVLMKTIRGYVYGAP